MGPIMRLMNLLVVTAILFLHLGHVYDAQATTCDCKQHSADAEASGTCSRTEDESNCTLSFTSTPPEAYEEFVSRLQGLGVKWDPREALRLVSRRPPEDFSGMLFELMPPLFAISQRTHFREATPRMLEAVRAIESSVNADRIRSRFVQRDGQATTIDEGNAVWIVSYGCANLRLSDIEFMIKTRWSPRLFDCEGEFGE